MTFSQLNIGISSKRRLASRHIASPLFCSALKVTPTRTQMPFEPAAQCRETINGLFKAEVIHLRGPWRSFDAVEYAVLEWVDRLNQRRLGAALVSLFLQSHPLLKPLGL